MRPPSAIAPARARTPAPKRCVLRFAHSLCAVTLYLSMPFSHRSHVPEPPSRGGSDGPDGISLRGLRSQEGAIGLMVVFGSAPGFACQDLPDALEKGAGPSVIN